MTVLPAIALVGGIAFYLTGGRYVTTDDAYVGAQKVLITPDISGKVWSPWCALECQRVRKNSDVLFEIDPVPFQFAVRQAQRANLDTAKTNYDNTRHSIQITASAQGTLMRQGAESW